MSEGQKKKVKNPSLVQELTESIEAYQKTTIQTLEGEKSLQNSKKRFGQLVLGAGFVEDGAVRDWDTHGAELLVHALHTMADQCEGQAKRLREQAGALSRMNVAVDAVRKEALDEG